MVNEPIGCPTPGGCSCPEAENGGYVTIPRAKFEALEAAAKALGPMVDRWEPDCGGTDRRMWENAMEALAALRAAGLHETEGGDS